MRAAKGNMNVEEAEDIMSIQNEIEHTVTQGHFREQPAILNISATPKGITILQRNEVIYTQNDDRQIKKTRKT